MLNEPSPEKRPAHPLERQPSDEGETPQRRPHPLEQAPLAPRQSGGAPRQTGWLHIPSVTPVATYALVVANLAIYALIFLVPSLGDNLMEWGADNPAKVLLQGEYHRLLTSMFLHASPAHVMLNMVVLYSFGGSLERIAGHARFLLIYFLGGLGGSILSVALAGDSRVYSVGASGAIFALVGAEYIFLYQHRKLMGAAGAAQRRNLVIMALINLGFGILTTVGPAQVHIDNWGHVGGLIGGLALAQLINPFYVVKRHPDHPDSNHLLAIDINPLNRKYWAVSIYVAVLIAILIVAAVIVR